MKATDRLFSEVKDLWKGYLDQPFVREITDGSLAPEKFRFYMVQDYLYLFDYTRIFAYGAAKAEDVRQMTFFSNFIYAIFHGELDMHEKYMSRLGISNAEIQNAAMSLDNISYTNYMLSKAQSGGVLDILAAVLSCSWSYAYIGTEIEKKAPEALAHPLYGEWISSYAGSQYQSDNRNLLTMVDQYYAGLDETRFQQLKEIFVVCSLYERDFWDMAYEMRK